MICWYISYLYFWFWFFFLRWIIRRYPGSFVLSGVCGNILSLLSKQLMEVTDCAKLLVAHLNRCILSRTRECLQSMKDTILWCQGGLC